MSTLEALQAIYDELGELSPEVVVDRASDPGHVLHDRFVWDDSVAAARYRLVQASGLIRSVQVEVVRSEDVPPVRVRAFVSDSEIAGVVSEETVGRYRPVAEVVSDDVARTAWFRSLERDWQALKRRAGASREFAEMVLADVRGLAG